MRESLRDEKTGGRVSRRSNAAVPRRRLISARISKSDLAEGEAVAGEHDFDAPDTLEEKCCKGEPHLGNEAAPLCVKTKSMTASADVLLVGPCLFFRPALPGWLQRVTVRGYLRAQAHRTASLTREHSKDLAVSEARQVKR